MTATRVDEQERDRGHGTPPFGVPQRLKSGLNIFTPLSTSTRRMDTEERALPFTPISLVWVSSHIIHRTASNRPQVDHVPRDPHMDAIIRQAIVAVDILAIGRDTVIADRKTSFPTDGKSRLPPETLIAIEIIEGITIARVQFQDAAIIRPHRKVKGVAKFNP